MMLRRSLGRGVECGFWRRGLGGYLDRKRFEVCDGLWRGLAGVAVLGGNRFAADGMLSLRGVSKPITLNFSWTPGASPVLNGTAVVKRLDFGVGTGDWADVSVIPNEIRINTKVLLQAKP